MTFTWYTGTKKDVAVILKRLEECLVCQHPQTPCDNCKEQPACDFVAALWRQLRKELE